MRLVETHIASQKDEVFWHKNLYFVYLSFTLKIYEE